MQGLHEWSEPELEILSSEQARADTVAIAITRSLGSYYKILTCTTLTIVRY